MAYQDQTIFNPATGQSIKFIHTNWDTNGQLLEMEASYPPGSLEPPSHYHPNQVEDFKVLYGKMKVRRNGKTTTYNAGEAFHIPQGEVHSMWNDCEHKVILIGK